MATLDDIVSVSISLASTGITSGDFGTGMIVAPHLAFAERVRTYSSYLEAQEDPLPDNVLKAISDYFGQSPRPKKVKVGRRAVLSATVSITPVNSTTYSIKVGADTYTYSSDSSATAAEIAAGLKASIEADTDEKVSATVSTNDLVLAWLDPEVITSVTLGANLAWSAIAPTTSGTPVASDLSAIRDEDDDWYGLVMVERVEATQLSAAEWTEDNEKLFITATADPDSYDSGVTSDLLSQLKAGQYYRTAALYHGSAATEYPDAAWAGRVFTIDPGRETWALKQLASITPDTLSTSQKSVIVSKGGNTFEYYSNDIALTNPGKVAAGEWIDVIRFRDWLSDQIKVNLVTMMINRDKVPYTDPGIQLCVNNLRSTLRSGQDAGGIAPDELDSTGATVPGFTISYPLAADVTPSVKATRVLSLSFAARLAGAIHAAEVTGTLSYEL